MANRFENTFSKRGKDTSPFLFWIQHVKREGNFIRIFAAKETVVISFAPALLRMLMIGLIKLGNIGKLNTNTGVISGWCGSVQLLHFSCWKDKYNAFIMNVRSRKMSHFLIWYIGNLPRYVVRVFTTCIFPLLYLLVNIYGIPNNTHYPQGMDNILTL